MHKKICGIVDKIFIMIRTSVRKIHSNTKINDLYKIVLFKVHLRHRSVMVLASISVPPEIK